MLPFVPPEVMLDIFRRRDHQDRSSLARVCQRLHRLSQEKYLWRELHVDLLFVERRFPTMQSWANHVSCDPDKNRLRLSESQNPLRMLADRVGPSLRSLTWTCKSRDYIDEFLQFLEKCPELKTLVVHCTGLRNEDLRRVCSLCPIMDILDIHWCHQINEFSPLASFANIREIITCSDIPTRNSVFLPIVDASSQDSMFHGLTSLVALGWQLGSPTSVLIASENMPSLEHLRIGLRLDVNESITRYLNIPAFHKLRSLHLFIGIDTDNEDEVSSFLQRLSGHISKVPRISLDLSVSAYGVVSVSWDVFSSIRYSLSDLCISLNNLISLTGNLDQLRYTQLSVLRLEFVSIKAQFLQDCLSLPQLKKLSMHRLYIIGQLPPTDVQEYGLRHLELWCVRFFNAEADVTRLLEKMHHLEYINLSGSNLYVQQLSDGHRFPSLRFLSMISHPSGDYPISCSQHILACCPALPPLIEHASHFLGPEYPIIDRKTMSIRTAGVWVSWQWLRSRVYQMPDLMMHCVCVFSGAEPWIIASEVLSHRLF